MSTHNQSYGDEGEDVARGVLEKKGYVWVASKYRTRWGEIDLIMKDRWTLVFVEVKRRSDDRFGEPEEAVNKTKKNHMVRAALGYVQENRLMDQQLRFDVVSWGPLGIRHFKSAFSAGREYYY